MKGELKRFIEQCGLLQGTESFFGYLAAHGKNYEPIPLSREEKSHVRSVALRTGLSFEPRECFYNAQMLAITDDSHRLTYCEGYGSKMIPCHHGWVLINNKVVDLTWAVNLETSRGGLAGKVYGVFSWEYFGIPITNTEYLRKYMYKEKIARGVLPDLMAGVLK